MFIGSKTEKALGAYSLDNFFHSKSVSFRRKLFQRDRARHQIWKVSRSYQNESMYVKQARRVMLSMRRGLAGPWKRKGLNTLVPSAEDGKPRDHSQSPPFPSCIWTQTLVSYSKRLRPRGCVSIWLHLLTVVPAQFKTTITEAFRFSWTSSIEKHPEDTSRVWWWLCIRKQSSGQLSHLSWELMSTERGTLLQKAVQNV